MTVAATVPWAHRTDRCAHAFEPPEPTRALAPGAQLSAFERESRRMRFGCTPAFVECARVLRCPATAVVGTSDKTPPTPRVFEAPSGPSQQHVYNSALRDKACKYCCETPWLEIGALARATSPAFLGAAPPTPLA